MAGVESINILPPLWNRNYGDVEEPMPSAAQPPVLTWSPSARKELTTEGQYPCDVLVVAIGGAACTFVASTLDDTKMKIAGSLVLPEADFSDCNLTSDPSMLASPASIITRAQGVLVVRLPRPPSAEAARGFDWTACLFSHIKPSRVVVVGTVLEFDYSRLDSSEAGSGSSSEQVLRALRTTQLRPTLPPTICPFLELPNLIKGTAAEILSHCEAYGVVGELYVAVERPNDPMSALRSLKGVRPALAPLPLRPNDAAAGQEELRRVLARSKVRRSAESLRSFAPGDMFL